MAKPRLLDLILTFAGIFFFTFSSPAAGTPLAAKWQRLELTFKSSVKYEHPLEAAEMRVLFVSPLGETNRVYGFWDGGRTWRVRFQPAFAGRWTYHTRCSDTSNAGLHEQSGEFICTASPNKTAFQQHGPIQVGRSRDSFEHADRSAFLWLGDAAWIAGLKAGAAEWRNYVKARATQGFTVIQWRLDVPEAAPKSRPLESDAPLHPNLKVMRQLDAKIAAANQAGLLCAIAPMWEIGPQSEAALSEEQAVQWMRYAVGRWGADHVAWIVAFESDSSGEGARRWQRIGRSVFGPVTHAPVILVPGESNWALDAFRSERWVTAFGFETTSAGDPTSLPWLWYGPLAQERFKTPPLPLLTVVPPMETTRLPDPGFITPQHARQLLWWSLLQNTPAGVSYCAEESGSWEIADQANSGFKWQFALDESRGGAAVTCLAALFREHNFAPLTPLLAADIFATSAAGPHEPIVAAELKSHGVTVIYVPSQITFTVESSRLKPRTTATWINPQTSERQPAVGKATSGGQSFTPPTARDWVLVLSPAVRTNGVRE